MFCVAHIQNVVTIKCLGGAFFILYMSLISPGHLFIPPWLFTCSHPLDKFCFKSSSLFLRILS
jgi:hypothetical protein